MPSLDFQLKSTASPDDVRAGILDFSPSRPKTWEGITPDLYKVYDVSETTAEIQEGTSGLGNEFWAREKYDWSNSKKITWTVVDSNFCQPGTTMSASIKPDGSGCVIDFHFEREGATKLGKVLMTLLVVSRGAPIKKSFQKGLTNLEAANAG